VKPTVLIVDDEPDISEVLSDLLGDAGYRVVVASQGKEALERLDQEHPDLMLLDVMMPVMSGEEVLEELARRGAVHSLPIVVTSAGEGRRLAERFGLVYLKKPSPIGDILGTVARLLAPGC
jgi:CheY-like chemotaxis protein